jgi:hypothetical protein
MNSTNDAAALQVYRTAMPGYEVIGITGASNTPWESPMPCIAVRMRSGQGYAAHQPHSLSR